MDPTVTIRLGDIFDDSALDVGIARFLVVSRQTAVLWNLLRDAPVQGGQLQERKVVLFSYYIGALKELVDAFHYLDSIGFVTALCEESNSLSDLREAALHAKHNLDKSNPDSIYAVFLKRVRDSAGFHVSLPEVKRGLKDLSDDHFPAAFVTGENQLVTELPCAAAILAYITANETIQQSADAARKLHVALEAVAHDLYFINVRIATER